MREGAGPSRAAPRVRGDACARAAQGGARRASRARARCRRRRGRSPWQDMTISIVKTGSGKTLGFLFPAFSRTPRSPRFGAGARARAARARAGRADARARRPDRRRGDALRRARVRTSVVYGGAPKFPQIRGLQAGRDLVVGTLGRLQDLMDLRKVDVSKCAFVVLDEADRMLDMGFEPPGALARGHGAPDAALHRDVAAASRRSPRLLRADATVQVNIGASGSGKLAASKNITQHAAVVPGRARSATPRSICSRSSPPTARTRSSRSSRASTRPTSSRTSCGRRA